MRFFSIAAGIINSRLSGIALERCSCCFCRFGAPWIGAAQRRTGKIYGVFGESECPDTFLGNLRNRCFPGNPCSQLVDRKARFGDVDAVTQSWPKKIPNYSVGDVPQTVIKSTRPFTIPKRSTKSSPISRNLLFLRRNGRVQEMRENCCRPTATGRQNLFSGLVILTRLRCKMPFLYSKGPATHYKDGRDSCTIHYRTAASSHKKKIRYSPQRGLYRIFQNSDINNSILILAAYNRRVSW